MSNQPEALRLADALDECKYVDVYRCKQAAAELRRLHQFAEDQIGRATAAEAALQMTKATHALKIAAVEAQRDALLEALRTLLSYAFTLEMRLLDADGEHRAMQKARAAIKAVEGGEMTDRELLELAAKAAGIDVNFDATQWDRFWVNGGGDFWNPLTDDGDALRLAVRLRFHATQFPISDDGFDAPLGMVEVWRVDDDDPLHFEFLRNGDDRLAVTRRAIVRAAAEIGKGMK